MKASLLTTFSLSINWVIDPWVNLCMECLLKDECSVRFPGVNFSSLLQFGQ